MTIIVRSHFCSSAESAERGSTQDMPPNFIHRTPWGTSTRWAVHLPAGPHLRSFKECLRSTLAAGKVVGRNGRRQTEAASAEEIQSRSNGRRALIPKMGQVQTKCLPARNNKVRRVDLVWPQAVTWQSPARLVRLAKKRNPCFHALCPNYPHFPNIPQPSSLNQPRFHQRRRNVSERTRAKLHQPQLPRRHRRLSRLQPAPAARLRCQLLPSSRQLLC